MRLLFIGDVMGRTGRQAIASELPRLRTEWRLDCVVVNGENAAGGAGITESVCADILAAGAVFIAREQRLLRPLNYPPGTPGRGVSLVDLADGRRVLVMNVMGRVFMDALDDPFAGVDREAEACPLGRGCDAMVVDVHAEATSEKMAMAHHLDGRASLVVGTHTHVPTADHQILPGGTAYLTDAGMTGDYDSVIGVGKEEPLRRFLTKLPSGRYEPAAGPATLCGGAVETDDGTGLARRGAPVRIGGRLSQARPEFWAASPVP